MPPTIAPVLSNPDPDAGAAVDVDDCEKLVDGVVFVDVVVAWEDVDNGELAVEESELENIEDEDAVVADDELVVDDKVCDVLDKLRVPVLGSIVVASESDLGVSVNATEVLEINSASAPLKVACTLVAKFEAVPHPY